MVRKGKEMLDLLLKPLRRSPFPAPEAFVRSIPERWLDPCVREHVSGMEVIRRAGAERYAFSEELPPAFRTEMHFARRHLYHLKDVSVAVRTGACAAGPLSFQESYGSLRRCLTERAFPLGPGRPLADLRTRTCAGSAPFYHFLLEELPRLLWVLSRHDDIEVMVHRGAPRYVSEILQAVASRRRGATLSGCDDETLLLRSYVFAQAEAYSGFVHLDDLALLRGEFLPPRQEAAGAGRAIYITRQNSSRSFDNEAELARAMRGSGFEVCALEELPFERQLELFRGARVVVAPHGGGLANLVWCDPGTRVIEIFSPRYFNDCFARLCCSLGLGYTPVWAEASDGWGRVSPDALAAVIAGENCRSGGGR